MDLKTRIENLLSEILTDKYMDEYGCKITLRFGPAEGETQGQEVTKNAI